LTAAIASSPTTHGAAFHVPKPTATVLRILRPFYGFFGHECPA